ncbi:udp-n-acetyl-d-glucosamine dehydrogenase : Putative dehydrogenase OS=Singulisphaera acidiphila (strain ATCC BAA-1392 / DSM 18658 / VKM B-2454 / MOB10) GN=Sinac_5599 PE=4 SV=1: GFO_IDH_MocA: GFO_IDH_MocA_C [Gemmataceae bacterium]|nr:udp-n-acetyl-d-glucosamine dehydrogenase : Putative dehydrogenase OS=Singulisphaera acidiphila (strain ATCC BAA-1392 / DSM 18658 / VKM B-2454 / MOB10) GN=Sinac_5599 PE=4 SV=1: GFO_IDH_MocA: GFO_IDH_MocA_C [Gemmataceae bacterium]VTU00835.1 udp-n-acetyl-d-glucosamine dehydrogenase : Putative dehydrogenase OS=Singulisphaera acidiphila (strain ATCC BAA-1392 / DSM 18658 / VKM B-2454 / MOB10) GN=Sinac_5599 PE=4 SV=1: GFO_IDH_MocA: GFO_IDH_MocA_C [Gemmataceae bacterium]
MTRLRMAVIGVGHLGQHHARILAGLPDVELVGVADANPEQARAIAAKLGTTPYGDIAPLVGRVDAVSVVTPTVHHHAVASTFLKAGVPVLVEKPVCRTVAEADELIELAARANVPFQVGHIERFNPAFEELSRRPIRPKFIEAERHGPFTGRSVDIGAVLDLMIHDLDLLLSLVGSPVRNVSAVGAAVFGGHEDMVNARLEFENGCVAHVTASRITRHPKRRLRVWAPEGYAGIDFVTRKLTLVQQSEEVREHGLDVTHLDAAAKARLKDEVFGRYLQVLNLDGDRKGDQLTSELKHFIHCVRTGNCPRVNGEDGRNALELAERVLTALRNHQWNGSATGPLGPNGLPEPAGFLFTPMKLAPNKAA